jgi:hypothetical protein
MAALASECDAVGLVMKININIRNNFKAASDNPA